MDLKKLAGQAGQLITRAVQYTEEKLGNAEKTEFDGHYDSLIQQYESVKVWTEKIMTGAQAVLIPNPGNRVEDMLFEKIEKRRPNRLSNLEYLGLDMVQAGNEFGPGIAYGSTLLKVGGAEQRLGLAERDFVSGALEGFVQPLHKFLDTEMKTIARERRVLDTKRLDLDVCKSRLRKSRSMDSQSAAEAELQKAQTEFDRQTEITKLLLEGVRSSQASHLRHLSEYVDAQAQYYEKCHEIMKELQKDLNNMRLYDGEPDSAAETAASAYPTLVLTNENGPTKIPADDSLIWRRAKVVCDYEATNKDEIGLKMNEEVKYESSDATIDPSLTEFVLVKKATSIGKVPRAYLEPLDD